LAVTLAAIAFQAAAEGTASAQAGYVSKTYHGSDCVYVTNPDRIAMTYSSSAGTQGTSDMRCPIVRQVPTYAHFYVEILFGTPSTDSQVGMALLSGDEKGNYEKQAEESTWVLSGSGYSYFLFYGLSLKSGETTFWSAMNDDAHAHWRDESLMLHFYSGNAPVLGYQVTEYP
jgi:hypothetical protein